MNGEYANRNGIYEKAILAGKDNKPFNINFKIK